LTIVLAFDGDEAGQRATDEAFLNLLDISDSEKGFLRSLGKGNPYREACALLSNTELADELALNTRNEKISGAPDWYTDMWRDNKEDCIAEINRRSRFVNDTSGRVSFIKTFNQNNTITDVLGAYGLHTAPGRSVRCPKHEDSSPSFSISKDDGRGYCFNQDCELWHDGHGVDAYELNKILGL
jgi:hypothetical protein